MAMLGISAFLLTDNPKTITKLSSNNSSINSTKNPEVSQNSSVLARLEGPKSAKEGNNIQIIWKITNNLDVPINDVQGIDQNEIYNFGEINPGETKTYSYFIYVPSLKEIKNDFGLNESISDSFYIGGFNIKYLINGVEHSTSSNSLEIDLV